MFELLLGIFLGAYDKKNNVGMEFPKAPGWRPKHYVSLALGEPVLCAEVSPIFAPWMV